MTEEHESSHVSLNEMLFNDAIKLFKFEKLDTNYMIHGYIKNLANLNSALLLKSTLFRKMQFNTLRPNKMTTILTFKLS